MSDTALSLAGVSRDGRDMIGAILDTYNRGNLLNMVSLSALIAKPTTPPAGDRPRSDLPFTATPLPPTPEVADLPNEVSDQVLALNALGAKPGPNRVVASIYKHIALWPGYLSLSWAQLAAMQADGSLLQLSDRGNSEEGPAACLLSCCRPRAAPSRAGGGSSTQYHF